MGKKVEKRDKTGRETTEEEARGAGNPEKPLPSADDYQCTGLLEQDFTQLCSRLGFMEIPRVVPRPRPPGTPASDRNVFADESDSWDKDSLSGSAPRDCYSYFRPSIRVELEGEDARSIREVCIKGWKIDEKMMGVFAKCLPALTNLQKINLWNVGLTDATFSSLVTILQSCPGVKLVQISLRNNQISDVGAQLIGRALQGLKVANKNLAALVLSYNHITDMGAGYIAKALRFNRSLLSLNLSSNLIGDQGALALAEVLGRFALTNPEIVERRRLFLEKDAHDQPRSPTISRHADAKSERPLSHHSGSAVEKAEKSMGQKTKTSVTKKKEKEKDPQKKEEKTNVSQATTGTSAVGTQSGAAKKEDAKAAKKQMFKAEEKNTRGKAVKSATKRAPQPEHEQTEASDVTLPLLEAAEFRDGNVYLPGNKVLMNLNLSRNRVTEKGLHGFLTVMKAQVQEAKASSSARTHTGLLRLSLGKNRFPAESPTFAQIQEIMFLRDPIHKSSRSSEDEQVM
ncbi:leucine-rich repeat-containing protein 71 isoform X3 [Ranitomeya variabilis]|uniref:leucine-rich repeat-containing protein 71 isoform X3 n=1 Tax=Ranitomeya variabilis TaxID=490064 RepID=UPI0040569E24